MKTVVTVEVKHKSKSKSYPILFCSAGMYVVIAQVTNILYYVVVLCTISMHVFNYCHILNSKKRMLRADKF